MSENEEQPWWKTAEKVLGPGFASKIGKDVNQGGTPSETTARANAAKEELRKQLELYDKLTKEIADGQRINADVQGLMHRKGELEKELISKGVDIADHNASRQRS